MTVVPEVTIAPVRPYYRAVLFIVALAVAISVFPLIWMGGLVTSKGAGLSVPDWPNSFGYNMWLFPPSQWIGGIFYEHTHRLLGTLSGFLSIALALFAWGPARKTGMRYAIGVFFVSMIFLAAGSIGLLAYLKRASQMTSEVRSGFSLLAVIFISLGLVSLIAWFSRAQEPRRWVRWLAIFQLVLIIVQGTLGGLRVTHISTDLAIIHACLAQCFFCLAAFTALAMSPWWQRKTTDRFDSPDSPAARFAVKLATLAVLATFAQLIVGAIMRHNQAGLAIPDLPLAFGKLLPPIDETGLNAANQIRNWNYHLDGQMTLTQIWLAFGHRMGAILVTLAIAAVTFQVFRKLRHHGAIRRVVVILCCLVVVQFSLGVITVWMRKPADIASLHVAVGALTFMMAVQTLAVIGRMYVRVKPVHGFEMAQADAPKGNLAAV